MDFKETKETESNIVSRHKISNYYDVNNDWTSFRNFEDGKKEIVHFHNNSFVRIWYNEQTDNYPEHWHNALEILMPEHNYYDAEIEGTHYHLTPGQILIIPPGMLHTLTAPSSGSRFIFLLGIDHLSGLKGFSGIQSLLSTPIYVTKENFPEIHDEVYQLLLEIRDEYFCQNEYAALSIQAQLILLLVKFSYNHLNTNDLFPNVQLYKQKEYVQKFNDLLDYIDAHYMEDLNLEEIAAQIGFSKFHFSRLFKQYTNFTFCDYLCYRRLRAAESLLVQPDLSVTEIALQVGFSSISTFNRVFKQKKKCSPSEYRRKNNYFTIHSQ